MPMEVFRVFLRLGLTSFGGPVAHLAYFHREFVEQRGWLSQSQYAQLLAMCQFLPGPASSQLGFAIGMLRAGWPGALAAFIAFTLPSALLMLVFASLLPYLDGEVAQSAIHGLKLLACAVVAHGVLGMSRQLCPDPTRATIACTVAAIVLLIDGPWVQLLAVFLGAMVGLWKCKDAPITAADVISVRYDQRLGYGLLVVFAIVLLGLPLLASGAYLQLLDTFYRAGALVFGGGHVVLPLLAESTVERGLLDVEIFLAGYGAAQAVPGPMFSFAAFLGAEIGPQPVAGATLALLGIFLPGFLLVAGVLPLWCRLSGRQHAASIIAGVNAAVVGLLGAALYDPVITSAIHSNADFAIALVGFTLLAALRLSPLYVLLWCLLASVLGAAM